MTQTEKIVAKSMSLLDAVPAGLRFSELQREIHQAHPEINENSIRGGLHTFRSHLPDGYYLPTRGHYRAIKYRDEPAAHSVSDKQSKTAKIKEEDFYEPFADWLVNELEEATRAISLGGRRFADKWGAPDVLAIREPRRSDIIQFPTEIIAAEIKLSVGELITAFGQCCSYKLFSHKSYLVVPESGSEEDLARLDSLTRIFGIGLVRFDASNPKDPEFTIRARASRDEPDMFYVNKYLKLVEDELFP